MKKIVYSTLVLSFIPLYFANAYVFTKDLRHGSSGTDVMELQKYLNANPATQISITGAGSPGSETTYFGSKTKEAVIRLQNINKVEILDPVGLTEGNGVVGKSTRAFLNQFQDLSNLNTDVATTTDADMILVNAGNAIKSISATGTIPLETDGDLIIKNLADDVPNIKATGTVPINTEIDKLLVQLAKEAKRGSDGGDSAGEAPSKTKVDQIILQLGDKLSETSGTSTQSGINNESFTISPQQVKPHSHVFVGSQQDISKVKFMIGSHTFQPKCFSKYTCRLRIPEGYPLGMATIKTDNPKLGSQKIEVISKAEKRPVLNVKKISLSKENTITGENLGAKMTIHTPYGKFETETRNNSFVLEFPKSPVLSPGNGFIFVENSSGMQSDILILPYEK